MTRSKTVPIKIRAIRKTDWPHITELFGNNGACGGCWCMFWRHNPKNGSWNDVKGDKNKRRLKSILTGGELTGALAFAGKEPVGWCSYGPKTVFPYFSRSRNYGFDIEENIWAVTCFFIKRGYRQSGIGTAMLKFAVDSARQRKVKALQGFPTTTSKRPGRQPDAFVWTGTPALFEACGFKALKLKGVPAPVYQRKFRYSV
ncbi:MAG: GNAT family N-acetyltransferase [Gammaproteobacteria bacterium]|nr:GNAT family N-acetyltransferase [Gammaproteobacteria bacterium]